MRCSWTILIVLTLGLALNPALAVEARLPRHPAPRPDGQEIAFSWQGDIWVVSAAGGPARRLTAHPAADRSPVWSRDGRWIAFASDRHGNADVFVMPRDGASAPRRLTYAAVDDVPLDFTADGSAVLFASRRDESTLRMPALYTVPISGGSAALAQSALGHWAAVAPDGRRLVFVRGGSPWSRRGYRGAANRDLWLREADGGYRRLTVFDGDDDCPSWLDDQRLVFLSSRAGRKNVFVLDLAGGEPQPLTAHAGADVRFPRAAGNGSLVAYECEDAIWVVSPRGGAPRRLTIEAPPDSAANPVERRIAKSEATELALAPDGKAFAFVSGGDVFVSALRSKDDQDVAPPPTVRVTATPAREQDLSWSPDGARLLFASARDGDRNIYVARRAAEQLDWALNHDFPVERLTSAPADERRPRYSPDGGRIAFVRGRGDLMLMDHDGGHVRTLLGHWTTPDFSWSPDGAHLAYSIEDLESNSEVFIIPAAGGEPYNVSRHPDEDVHPIWSSDGRRLFWLTKRRADSIDVWSVWLSRADEERTAEDWLRVWKAASGSAGAAKPAAEAPTKAKAAASGADGADRPRPEVKIDFDRLWERARPLTDLPADESDPVVADGGRRIVFSAAHEGERDLYSIRWDRKDLKRLTTGDQRPRAVLVDRDGQTVFFINHNGVVQRVGLDGKAGDPAPFAARHEFDAAAQRAAVFDEAARLLDDWFYDPEFHGVDWAAQCERHRDWALAASSPADFADVMNILVGELNASHLRYRPLSPNEGEETGWIGALFDPAAGGAGVRVREVLDDSPAARLDVKLQAGERLLAVNGRPVERGLDVYALFADTAGERTALTIEGLDGARRTVVVVPTPFGEELALRHRQWVRERRALVDRLSGGRLGYLHIQGMDLPSFETFERDLYAAAHGKDGLLIDVRSNGGGWTADYLFAALNVRRHAYTAERGAPRGVKAYPQDRLPLAAYTRPAATLCNEESYSNAEIFAHAFQALGRGQLIGAPTFGAVISTTDVTLLDGATFRLPHRGWWSAASGLPYENRGAVPDVVVLQPPEQDASADQDAQLERAVEELLQGISSDPRRDSW